MTQPDFGIDAIYPAVKLALAAIVKINDDGIYTARYRSLYTSIHQR